jgi:hypothetical protein
MIPKLYEQYFIDKQDERRQLFSLARDRFSATRGIYPGSFVHITPSFYIPEMAYIDSDRRIDRFFSDEGTVAYIEEQKDYADSPSLRWAQADYASAVGIPETHYQIMFSFYAGFISRECKKFLSSGGILIANNSHGDASLALTDPDYRPIGVILRNGDRFGIQTEQLSGYLTKKDGTPIDPEKVRKRMVGEKFIKSAYAYVFEKQ